MNVLKKLLLLQIIVTGITATSNATDTIPKDSGAVSIEGRWDMTVLIEGKQVPSWLEVRHSGLRTLVGQFVGSGGSARPISRVYFQNGAFHFSVPPQWETDTADISVAGRVQNDGLAGTLTASNGAQYTWTAVRAPALRRSSKPTWGKPVVLFNGKDLNGWHALGENQWVAENGILRSPRTGSNLVTDKSFTDFKLHIEFRYGKESNSGVYLRGRYEVQIADSKGKEPLVGELGAVYGFLTPTEQVAKEAGAWQTYDITLVGRMVSVVANGKQIICNQAIPGITGGALDSKEGEPGPLLLQGDHGPIEYRNITLTPAN
jgi:hypothetical protein